MNPDATVPEDMVNALYYVHETASQRRWTNCSTDAAAGRHRDRQGHEVSVADVSVQIWLAQPMLLQRQHAETVAFQRSNFMYFAGSRRKKGRRAPDHHDAIAKASCRTGWTTGSR